MIKIVGNVVNRSVRLSLLLLTAGFVFSYASQGQSSGSAANPPMARLAKVLAGDWNIVEIMQHGQSVVDGAGRRGTVHVTLVGGGTALVSEGHSAGATGGDLQWSSRFGGTRTRTSIGFSPASRHPPT